MARNRMIKPQFWSDEKTGLLSDKAKLLFIGMWNFADDEGKIRGHPSYLRSSVFPYSDESSEIIKTALDELSAAGIIVTYRVNDQSYILIKNFLKHQKIDKPQESQIPNPTENDLGIFDEHSHNDIGTLDEYYPIKEKEERESKRESESENKEGGLLSQPTNLDHSYLQFKDKYPRDKQNVQPGMTRAQKVWSKSVNGHATEIFTALENYCKSDNVQRGYIMGADKFITDSWRDYLDFKKFGKDEQDGPIELL